MLPDRYLKKIVDNNKPDAKLAIFQKALSPAVVVVK